LFFSYFASVLLLSLAIYGLWQLIHEVWRAYLAWRLPEPLRASLLIIVNNSEMQIESMVRYLLEQAADDSFWCEFVIIDYASEDITPVILDRLEQHYPMLRVFHLSHLARPISEGIAVCRGEVVYVLDFVNRLRVENFTTAINIIRQ